MSKIPIPGLNGIMTMIETDPKPMTAEEEQEHDKAWKLFDQQQISIIQNKLTSLQWKDSPEMATLVYQNHELTEILDFAHHELLISKRIADMVSSVEVWQSNIEKRG